MSLPPPPLYPQWPPARRRFRWWEALVGLLGPVLVALPVASFVGFRYGFVALFALSAVVCTGAAVRRRLTLLFAWIAGVVLVVAVMLVTVGFALFTAHTA